MIGLYWTKYVDNKLSSSMYMVISNNAVMPVGLWWNALSLLKMPEYTKSLLEYSPIVCKLFFVYLETARCFILKDLSVKKNAR